MSDQLRDHLADTLQDWWINLSFDEQEKVWKKYQKDNEYKPYNPDDDNAETIIDLGNRLLSLS